MGARKSGFDGCYEGEWWDGWPHSHGTWTAADGIVYQGQWREGCFGKRPGRWAALMTSAEACGFE